MADDIKKKELGKQTGYSPGYGPGYSPGYGPPDCGPGYEPGCPGHGPTPWPTPPPAPDCGMPLCSRLRRLVGSNVTVFWVDGAAIRGTLVEVGADYIIIQRSPGCDGCAHEAVFLPLASVAVVGPVKK